MLLSVEASVSEKKYWTPLQTHRESRAISITQPRARSSSPPPPPTPTPTPTPHLSVLVLALFVPRTPYGGCLTALRSQRLPLVAVGWYVAARESVPNSFTYRVRELFLSKHIHKSAHLSDKSRGIRRINDVGYKFEHVALGSGEFYLLQLYLAID